MSGFAESKAAETETSAAALGVRDTRDVVVVHTALEAAEALTGALGHPLRRGDRASRSREVRVLRRGETLRPDALAALETED